MTVRKAQKRKSKGNRLGVFAIGFVVVLLLSVLSIQTVQLRATQEAYLAQREALEAQYAAEELRTKELEEYRVYVQTKQYIESIARQKLGLINPGEVLLKPNN